MATISETLQVPIAPETAFDHIADFTTAAAWDPGVARSERLDAGPLQVGSRFRVHLALGPLRVPIIYTITTYDRPDHVVLTTKGIAHHGVDDVRFRSRADGGAEVEWNAMFRLRGPGRFIDPVLGSGFRDVAAKAVAGLEASLRALAQR